jgi:hypothetical protein
MQIKQEVPDFEDYIQVQQVGDPRTLPRLWTGPVLNFIIFNINKMFSLKQYYGNVFFLDQGGASGEKTKV